MVRTKQKSWTTPRPINGIKVSFKNMHYLYSNWQIYWVNKCKQAVCFVLKIKISCFSTMLFSLNITCTCISFNLIYLTIYFFQFLPSYLTQPGMAIIFYQIQPEMVFTLLVGDGRPLVPLNQKMFMSLSVTKTLAIGTNYLKVHYSIDRVVFVLTRPQRICY